MAEKTVAAPAEVASQTSDREGTRAEERYVSPPVDIYETKEGLMLVADLPGVTAEGLDIQVKDDILTINGRVRPQMLGEPVYCEYELLSFFRQFQLAEDVDTSRITAQLRNGVLELSLPKAEAAKPKTIKVELG